MKKRLTCDIRASIDIYVEIPEHLIETFEKYDELDEDRYLVEDFKFEEIEK